jgi:hypothetical protein
MIAPLIVCGMFILPFSVFADHRGRFSWMTGDSEEWETLFKSTDNQVAGSRELDPAYLGEPCSLHPGGIFNFTVAGAGKIKLQ